MLTLQAHVVRCIQSMCSSLRSTAATQYPINFSRTTTLQSVKTQSKMPQSLPGQCIPLLNRKLNRSLRCDSCPSRSAPYKVPTRLISPT